MNINTSSIPEESKKVNTQRNEIVNQPMFINQTSTLSPL